MKRLLFVGLILVVLMGALVAPVAASGGYPTVTYVVKPGDTLASIARQFCTTWQQIYHMNQAVIGPNPNVLRAGTVLQVPNQCGGQPPTPQPPPSGGCNLGPIPHAMGPLNGNIYTVVAGDTLFSIARRFCTTVNQLAATNHIPNPARIYVGQKLVVPVGTTPPPPQRYLTMTFPVNGAVLPGTWTATGTGAGLFEGNVVVTAFTNAGVQIAQQATILQGANVGTGGPGTWSATLNTSSVAPGTAGYVIASSPQSNVQPVRVNVTFGQGQPQQRYLTMSFPTNGAVLPGTWTATGTGAGLFEGNVVVTAFTNAGAQIAQQATTLQGANVGTGGPGTWSVTLNTTSVAPGTAGYVIASSPQSNVQPVRADVTFGQAPAGASISITSPTANMTLPRTFNVMGTASGVQPGSVVVQALNSNGTVLFAESAVAVPGGSGSWFVTLTVAVPSTTAGQIVVFWTQNVAVRSTIPVTFSGM